MTAGAVTTTSLKASDTFIVDNGGPLNVQVAASTMATFFGSGGGTTSITASLTGNELDAIQSGSTNYLVSQSTIANLFGATASVYTGVTTVSLGAGTTTVTLSSQANVSCLTSTGLVAALTVHLPAAPVNGQVGRFSLDQNVTALTVTSTGSVTMRGNTFTGTQSNGGVAFIYNAANTTWYRY